MASFWNPSFLKRKPTEEDSYAGMGSLNYGNTQAAASPESKPSTSGMGTEDYVGLALQLYGASMADKAAEAEQQKEDERYSKGLELQGRDFRQNAQQFEEQMQNEKRGMNMNAFGMLADQRMRAMQDRRYRGMRTNFARALSGGA